MSFSGKVKKELAEHISNASHCRIAELAALISMCGSVIIDEDNQYSIRVRTETKPTAVESKAIVVENISYGRRNYHKRECIFTYWKDIYFNREGQSESRKDFAGHKVNE